MKYKLNSRAVDNPHQDIVKYLLYNNGIDETNAYIDNGVYYSYKLLQNIESALKLFDKHINADSNIAILVDSDFDGFSSASVIYQYIVKYHKHISIFPLVRIGKQHGLSQEVYCFSDKNNINLLIVPDAMCDIELSKEIKEKLNCDILVLDHHETKEVNPYATIVNPNYIGCNYPNKYLSGCAVTWKFIQALDDKYKTNFADSIIDLVGASIVSDIMNIKELENRTIVSAGCKNIKNEFLLALIKAQSFSLKGKTQLNGNDFGWTIIPLVNSLIRIGSLEDVEIMFKAFCEVYEEFPYKKRGTDEITQEDTYTRASRSCTNAKARQTKTRDKDILTVKKLIADNELEQNKIIIVDTNGTVNNNLSGLTASNIANEYNTPVCIISSYKDDLIGGSARNYDDSYIVDFKDYLNSTGLVEMAEGHQSAFGVHIKRENLDSLIIKANQDFENATKNNTVKIEKEIDYEAIDICLVNEISEFDDYIVNEIKKPKFVIKNIPIDCSKASVKGKNLDTWKFVNDDEIEMIKFKCADDTILDRINQMANDIITIDAIATIGFNNFDGIFSPQIVIKEYEVKDVIEIDSIDDINWGNEKSSNDDWDDLWSN